MTKGDTPHGEFVLNHSQDLLAFALVVLLGFMPLIIIHWGGGRPALRPERSGSWRDVVTKTSLLVVITDWLASFNW
jgi:hypothetical protein